MPGGGPAGPLRRYAPDGRYALGLNPTERPYSDLYLKHSGHVPAAAPVDPYSYRYPMPGADGKTKASIRVPGR